MIGVSKESKNYMLYNLKTQKFITNGDVAFKKDERWDQSNEDNQQVIVGLEVIEENVAQKITLEVKKVISEDFQNELLENDSIKNNILEL